jgi:uncharacterized flavoprotein (TIGR03862 family)
VPNETAANLLARPGIVVIGGGPAGLMAAESAAALGMRVDLYDAMPSVGRKFLLAGKGGMNITHSEPRERFQSRYGSQAARVGDWLNRFDAQALRTWAHELGIATFVGTSGRVFPDAMKAGPLLRAWLRRLREQGVAFHVRHRWMGWDGEALRFAAPDGTKHVAADVVVLALGGGSWARLGSDGAWTELLVRRGVPVADLRPANCGFERPWSEALARRWAGHPVKNVAARADVCDGWHRGEFVITDYGVEGGLVYALSQRLRERIESQGAAVLTVDLAPDLPVDRLCDRLMRQKPGRSLADRLRRVGIEGARAALVRELVEPAHYADPARLAAAIKSVSVAVQAPRPLDEAISSAGGVALDALDAALMLGRLPGVFCAGEMVDWEAPTGGYLLTACFASGRIAGEGAARWATALAAGRGASSRLGVGGAGSGIR